MKHTTFQSGTGLVTLHPIGASSAAVEPGASLARHLPPPAATIAVAAAAALTSRRPTRAPRATAAGSFAARAAVLFAPRRRNRLEAAAVLCDHGHMRTILVVDDHPSFRSTARALLHAEGFDVVGEAADGESALRAIARLRPDVVLLDVQLPDMDGFEVTARVLRDGRPPKIVLTSSRDAADFGPLVETSGAVGFVPKDALSGAAVAALLE
jgi:CheY-like chemotaxis protein